jgi:hypothetical protein
LRIGTVHIHRAFSNESEPLRRRSMQCRLGRCEQGAEKAEVRRCASKGRDLDRMAVHFEDRY